MTRTTRSSKRRNASPIVDVESEDVKPPKRPRLEASPVVPLSELVKHPELWLADGNIVLAAGHSCFKVHRSQLARLCTVFEEMLGMPSGGPDKETIEDCVVVRMPDDAQDLTRFLEAIYNGCHFDFNTNLAANFPAISGVMRLATKYDCTVLCTRIRGTLSTRYPARLDGIHGCLSLWNAPHHTHVVLLARECDLLELLPSCFYQLTFAQGGEPIALLPLADENRMKEGKAAVLRCVAQLIEKGPPSTAAACRNANNDAAPRGRRSKRAVPKNKRACFLDKYWAEEVYGGDDPLGVVVKDPIRRLSNLSYPRTERGSLTHEQLSELLCQACRSTLIQHMQKIKTEIWDNPSKDFRL